MNPGCKLCSGIQAQISGAESNISELKKTQKDIFDKLDKMPSTKVLLSVIAIIVSLVGIIATIGYLAHQSRMAGIEATTVSLQQQINHQYATIGARLQGIESFNKKPESPKAAIKK